MLELKVGDVIHDCDGWNHVVVKEPHIYKYRGGFGFMLPWTDFSLDLEGGRCSCGCSVPVKGYSVEMMKQYVLDGVEYFSSPGSSWPASPGYIKLAQLINDGVEVFDTRGILLPEYECNVLKQNDSVVEENTKDPME